ncbi:MAG: helix-turn-helix domain-containing protein [Lentibacter algarum]
MSFKTYRQIAETPSFNPLEKLVMFQLASFQNEHTKRCNPSPERIAHFTKLSAHQVRRILRNLENNGAIKRSPNGWDFFIATDDHEPALIPSDWWPDERSIETLQDLFPHHNFDMEEAVNDFIDYCNANARIAPHRYNFAFLRNISSILENRQEGRVQISRQKREQDTHSVGASIARRYSA